VPQFGGGSDVLTFKPFQRPPGAQDSPETIARTMGVAGWCAAGEHSTASAAAPASASGVAAAGEHFTASAAVAASAVGVAAAGEHITASAAVAPVAASAVGVAPAGEHITASAAVAPVAASAVGVAPAGEHITAEAAAAASAVGDDAANTPRQAALQTCKSKATLKPLPPWRRGENSGGHQTSSAPAASASSEHRPLPSELREALRLKAASAPKGSVLSELEEEEDDAFLVKYVHEG
jgi:hypothetical protein